MWWLLPTVVTAGLLEILGWSARLWLSKSPTAFKPYEMQLVGTILGPTPLLAANFVILGRIINVLGTQFSRLPPRLSFDIVCLIVQGVGGAIAANAFTQRLDPATGGHIMLSGIVAQMACIFVFLGCAIEFLVRFHYGIPIRKSTEPFAEGMGSNVKCMVAALGFMTACILVRAVYRTCELAQGWTGSIITNEIYFDICDGGMVLLAIYTLNFVHPGFILGGIGTGVAGIGDKNCITSELSERRKASVQQYPENFTGASGTHNRTSFHHKLAV
ncbi:hypothetical protein ID866_2864 [Astraeus odoratus]|nr:hypothetical protein ID866_2864 [Astraeus odoratus]